MNDHDPILPCDLCGNDHYDKDCRTTGEDLHDDLVNLAYAGAGDDEYATADADEVMSYIACLVPGNFRDPLTPDDILEVLAMFYDDDSHLYANYGLALVHMRRMAGRRL